MYSMEGQPILLHVAMPIAVPVGAAFGIRWRPSFHWALAVLLAAIPLVERWVYAVIGAAVFGGEPVFAPTRELTLWAGFYVLPIVLVFGQARLLRLRSHPALMTFAGFGTYLTAVVVMFFVFLARGIIQP